MHSLLTIMATADAEKVEQSFFSALGIDWMLLAIQMIAFLVLLWFLGKFVYPPLTRMLEKREQDIEASVKAAKEAEEKADASKAEINDMLKKARQEAKDIVSTAKEEAVATLSAADAKSKERADRLIQDAEQEISKTVEAARKTLHNETLSLVADATEKVAGKVVSAQVDDTLIKSAIKEVR